MRAADALLEASSSNTVQLNHRVSSECKIRVHDCNSGVSTGWGGSTTQPTLMGYQASVRSTVGSWQAEVTVDICGLRRLLCSQGCSQTCRTIRQSKATTLSCLFESATNFQLRYRSVL